MTPYEGKVLASFVLKLFLVVLLCLLLPVLLPLLGILFLPSIIVAYYRYRSYLKDVRLSASAK